MKILEDYKELQAIVEKRAKYQKVMLVFDEYCSENEINNIYENIKNLCIFNKINIKDDIKEIYNGYKLIIFCVSVNSFIKYSPNIEEFVNIFISQDGSILPYFLDTNFKISKAERYILLNNKQTDINAISSIFFNRFYNYISDLLCYQFSPIHFDFSDSEITQFNVYKMIENVDSSYKFIDIEIVKEMDIDYNKLTLLNVVLCSAILCIIKAIESQSLELVDIYKIAKDDMLAIDRFYALVTNNSLTRVVELNFNFLISALTKTKEKLLSFVFSYYQQDLEEIIKKLKQYSFNCNQLLGYLYLYNVFGY